MINGYNYCKQSIPQTTNKITEQIEKIRRDHDYIQRAKPNMEIPNYGPQEYGAREICWEYSESRNGHTTDDNNAIRAISSELSGLPPPLSPEYCEEIECENRSPGMGEHVDDNIEQRVTTETMGVRETNRKRRSSSIPSTTTGQHPNSPQQKKR